MSTVVRNSKTPRRNSRKEPNLESETREMISAFQLLLGRPTREISSFVRGYRFRCTFAWSAERCVGASSSIIALVRAVELYCSKSEMPEIPIVAKPGRLGRKTKEEYLQSFPLAIRQRSRGKLLIERFVEHRKSFGHDATFALRAALAIYAEDAKKPPSPDPW